MARISRTDQDRAATPGFPRQSDPAGSASPAQRTGRGSGSARHASAASHAAPAGHHAEILDFERLSARRHLNEEAQNASFSAFVSARNRQVRQGEGAGEPAGSQRADRPRGARATEAPEHARRARAQGRHADAQQMPAVIQRVAERFGVGSRAGEAKAARSRAATPVQERAADGRPLQQASKSGKTGKATGFSLPFHLSFDWIRSSRPAQISAVVCACLILGCAFVYPSAKDAYTAVRNADQAEAEYQAVLARNDEIQSRIDTLNTDEGIEDLARTSYGYVMEGEQSVRVSGLGSQSIAADAENQTPAVTAGSVAPPETWYSPVLDIVFGYTPDNATTTSTDESSS